jgi:SAM-dependent methyltransferase
MVSEEVRKTKERELHDHLRGDLSHDPHYSSNRKYYSISQSNQDFVNQWLAKRCRGKRVLDYCCGNGHYAMWLAELGARAFGIDISPVSVQNAAREASSRGLGERAVFSVMDAESTGFPDGFFDNAVVNGVLHHLDLPRAYAELARVLKPGGAVICTEALRHNVFIHAYRKLTPHLRSEWEVEHILGRDEIELARRYFDQVEVARFFHLADIAAVPFRNLPIFTPTLRTLQAVDDVLLRTPGLQWQAWMAVFILAQPKSEAARLS